MLWELSAETLAADLPGYEILNPVGQGAMGRVFVARQTALGRLVAIKFLRINDEDDPMERLARFRREAALTAAMSHPNVLSVYDFGEIEGRPYLVMEYVPEGDLRRRMPASGPMPLEEVAAILEPIGEALAYLHGEGVLHRDLKPENILMQGSVPKVADFGIAVERTGSGDLTRSDQGLGTLGYVAPEQQYRLPVDERADQYSLAAMTYELLTGQRPLGVFKPPSHHNPKIGPAIDRVVLRALDEDREHRFASVQAFVESLARAIRGREPRAGAGWLSVLMAAVLVLACGVAGWTAWLRANAVESAPALVHPPSPAILPVWPASLPEAFRTLTIRRAETIWHTEGDPEGEDGEAVSEANWFRAEREVRAELVSAAGKLWEARARRGPVPDPAEVAKVWDAAHEELLKEAAKPPHPPERP